MRVWTFGASGLLELRFFLFPSSRRRDVSGGALGERELRSAHAPKPVESILRLRHDPNLEQPVG